jgi:hypothetical protein
MNLTHHFSIRVCEFRCYLDGLIGNSVIMAFQVYYGLSGVLLVVCCVVHVVKGKTGNSFPLDLKKSMPGDQRLGKATATKAHLLILTACSRRGLQNL